MTEITSAMEIDVGENQPRKPSDKGKDVAGLGAPPQSKATPWVEKYRPESLDDVAAHRDIIGSSLPFELVEEILGRVPIESLIRFRSICKQWYGLFFKDKRFIYKHLDLSQEQQRFIRMHHDMVQIINPVTLDLLCLPVPDEFLYRDTYSFYNNAFYIVHCDGLLLCGVGDRKGSVKLAVWNPVLSQIKWIQPLRSYHPFDLYGFGYDNGSYKILRMSYELSGNGYEIYDFKSKLWRAFPATFDWSPSMQFQSVSMKGNMYWLADLRANSEMFIQSFDFSRETFKPICSSLPFEVRFDLVRCMSLDIVALSGFRGDRLSLLHQPHVGDDNTREIKIDVWVSNKVTDGVVSWTKYFNVTRSDLPIIHPLQNDCGNPTYFIHKTNGIMLWCDKAVQEDYACASFYEISEGEIKKQVETGPRYRAKKTNPCICGYVYVPSLVPVPE